MFAKLQKVTISFIMSVCPPVHVEHLGSHWIDFHEIWYLNIFKKIVEKTEVSLISDENNGVLYIIQYSVWRQVQSLLQNDASI